MRKRGTLYAKEGACKAYRGASDGHRGVYEAYRGASMRKRGTWEARVVCVTFPRGGVPFAANINTKKDGEGGGASSAPVKTGADIPQCLCRRLRPCLSR